MSVRPDKILPCPFCGDDDPYFDGQIINGKEINFLVCRECGAEGPYDIDPYQAAHKWNERTA